MQVCLIQAVANKGINWSMAKAFEERLLRLVPDAQLMRFVLPQDGPGFCIGCKLCFIKDMSACPHLHQTLPIWQALEGCDLAVFITPTYAFGIPAQLKALLDHFASRWIVHKPSPRMLPKQALIINQSVGAGFASTKRLLWYSLRFWGFRRVRSLTARMGELAYERVEDKVKTKLYAGMEREIMKALQQKDNSKPALIAKLLYRGMAFGHKMINRMLTKKDQPQTSDYLFWHAQGWLAGKFPWKAQE